MCLQGKWFWSQFGQVQDGAAVSGEQVCTTYIRYYCRHFWLWKRRHRCQLSYCGQWKMQLVACTSDTVWRSYVDGSVGMLGCPSCTAECCLNIPRWGSHICTYKCMSLCQKKPDWYEDNFCRLKAHTVLTFWSWKINLSGKSPTKCSRSGPTGLQYVDTRQVGKGWQRWVNFGHDGPILPVTVR